MNQKQRFNCKQNRDIYAILHPLVFLPCKIHMLTFIMESHPNPNTPIQSIYNYNILTILLLDKKFPFNQTHTTTKAFPAFKAFGNTHHYPPPASPKHSASHRHPPSTGNASSCPASCTRSDHCPQAAPCLSPGSTVAWNEKKVHHDVQHPGPDRTRRARLRIGRCQPGKDRRAGSVQGRQLLPSSESLVGWMWAWDGSDSRFGWAR